MKCLVFSNTVHSGSIQLHQPQQPHQPTIDIITNEKLTIRPTPLV